MSEQLLSMLNILLAGVLGLFIGLERKLRSKEAGVRTHTIVCIASALFMVISKQAFGDPTKFDPARVAAQIIPGIGFLGAGIIVYRKNVVHGLTTAAGVWATAGVGMACGGGLHIIATLSAALLIVLQFIFHTKKGPFAVKKYCRLSISFKEGDEESAIIKDLFNVQHFYRFQTTRNNDEIVCECELMSRTLYTSKQLNDFIKQYPFIIYIKRVDEE